MYADSGQGLVGSGQWSVIRIGCVNTTVFEYCLSVYDEVT